MILVDQDHGCGCCAHTDLINGHPEDVQRVEDYDFSTIPFFADCNVTVPEDELARRIADTIVSMREQIRDLQEYAFEDGLDIGIAGRTWFVPTPAEEQEMEDAG